MNTLDSTTLASFNNANAYDHDGFAGRESPPLQSKTLRLRITPSPPPQVTEVKPSLGDAVLIRFLADGRDPTIAQLAGEFSFSDRPDDCVDGDDSNDVPAKESPSEYIELGSEGDNERPIASTVGDPRQGQNLTSRPFRYKQQVHRSLATETLQSSVSEQRLAQYSVQEHYTSPSTLRRGVFPVTKRHLDDGAMSLDDTSPPPPPPPSQQERRSDQKREREGDQDEEPTQGQDHERQLYDKKAHKSPSSDVPNVFANLAAMALAAQGTIALPGPPSNGNATRVLGTGSSSTALGTVGRETPNGRGENNGPQKLKSMALNALRLDESGTSLPSHPEYDSRTMEMNPAVRRNANDSSSGSTHRQDRQHYPLITDPQNPNTEGAAVQQPEQAQLLTPASAATPRDTSSSRASAAFGLIPTRDNRSVASVSTGSTSLATPSTIHSPSDYAPSPYSPHSGSVAASPRHVTTFPSLRNHQSRQSTASALRSLPSIQKYAPPHNADPENALSPITISDTGSHFEIGSTNGSTDTSTNGSKVGAPRPTPLPSIRQYLADKCIDTSPANADNRPQPYIQPCPGFARLPSVVHHSPPLSSDELFRRGSDIASPGSSVVGNTSTHYGGSQYHFSPTNTPSSYSGSRRGTIDYGTDTTQDSTQQQCPSPGYLQHSRLPPLTSAPPPLSLGFPVIHMRNGNGGAISSNGSSSSVNDPIRRQQPTIASLTNPPPQPQQPQGTYRCKVAGCTSAPFVTQYLLSSHANVHSSERPHYCPVKGCPRNEPGKGFKRKNEMIRHGLVHQSPGYVCPFCPDREHKYPRPDNLQRHVRVHHKDKNMDDQALRDVLSQRADGPSRGRRRRN